MKNDDRNVLAFYMPYGNEENKTDYFQEDLADPDTVKSLFDYCQILERYFTYAGWLFLLKHYGYNRLYEIDQKSGWFGSASLDEFMCNIDLEMANAKKIEFDTCYRDTLC